MPLSSASPDPSPPPPDRSGSDTAASGLAAEELPLLAVGFYELLQLPPTATAEQLRQSFRRLSKRYHPDTTSLPAPAAAKAFQRLKRAYSVLSDPGARRLYDESLRRPVVPAPSPPERPVSLRRALSGGEWFALLLLAIALLLSLVLGIGVAWARGAELVRWPSWWAELHPAALARAEPDPAGRPDLEVGPDLEDGIVGRPQSSPLTAAASHVDAL